MTLLSDEAERLIREARGGDGPPPERLRAISRKLLPKLAAGGVVALSAAKATALTGAAAPLAAKAALGAGSLVSLLFIGGAAGVVLVTASTLWRDSTPKPTPRETSVAAATVSNSAVTRAPALERSAAVEPPQPPANEAPRLVPSSHVAELPGADPASALAAEVHLLNGAQHWIAAGDGPRALAIVDRYLAQYPQGALREELLAARVLALCLSGDHRAARSAARAFVADNPRSPQLPRLARSCAADVEGLPRPVDSVTDPIPGED
jgi:hypothetical protein